MKHTAFQPKIEQEALKKVAKAQGFYHILSSKRHKFRLKLGVFDDFVTSKRTKTSKKAEF